MKAPLCVLTIAGSDSGAGAGIQADARAIQALGAYALTAITAVTAQNSRRVAAWRPVAPALIAAQVETVWSDFRIGAVKTGLLPGAAAVRAVAAVLARHPACPLVVDPIIGSTSGTVFLSAAGRRSLVEQLFPLAQLVTPNWPEATLLTGQPVRSEAEAEAAGRALLATGVRAVLVKGGHGSGATSRDCLLTGGGPARWFSGPRIATRNTHGTGCVLSAAIATGLAQGLTLAGAVSRARRWLTRHLALQAATDWNGGRGPAFPGLGRP